MDLPASGQGAVASLQLLPFKSGLYYRTSAIGGGWTTLELLVAVFGDPDSGLRVTIDIKRSLEVATERGELLSVDSAENLDGSSVNVLRLGADGSEVFNAYFTMREGDTPTKAIFTGYEDEVVELSLAP